MFAKSCNLPAGIINHHNPSGFVPLEQLKDYGDWAVLGTGSAVAAGGTPLKLIGGSASAAALATRLGGKLSLGLAEGILTAGVATGAIVGTVAMLLPNNTSADSAFYTKEQFAMLTVANTRVRVNIKQLPDGSVDAYGFYTGTKPAWQSVQVIRASARGEQFVADLGQGIELIWTPVANPNETLGIPALEGAPKLPTVWVYPPTEKTVQILVNPVYPSDYQDAIIWFPNTGVQPIYVALSVPGDHKYHRPPASFPAFPDLKRATPKTRKKGGVRPRWKDKTARFMSGTTSTAH
nr:S-type pyocin domain-containing protein [Pseudomonas cavernicola]